MALSLPGARQLADEVPEALRLRAVRGCERGFTQTDIADLLGVSQETVGRWWTADTAGGPPRRSDRAPRRLRADPLG